MSLSCCSAAERTPKISQAQQDSDMQNKVFYLFVYRPGFIHIEMKGNRDKYLEGLSGVLIRNKFNKQNLIQNEISLQSLQLSSMRLCIKLFPYSD